VSKFQIQQDISFMRRIRHIHFVGIGGVGMGGIAEVLLHEGYTISGSDLNRNSLTEHLSSLGATVYQNHDASYVNAADVVVVSSAIKSDNVEVIAAKEKHIPVVPRAAMLAELMRFRYGIAIAGTHGKTTTTSLTASLLAEGKLDPTFVIGGKLNSAGTNAKLGDGNYLVAEADESDASFLRLLPMIAVVTNIDADHMATYHGNFGELKNTFIEFLHRLPFYGLAVVCIDDSVAKTILPKVLRPIITYGFDQEADIQASDYYQKGTTSCFNVKRKGYKDLAITLNLPGTHNVLNALAAIAVATELGISDQAIVNGLKKFQGVGRRFQYIGDFPLANSMISVIDDYGHHPREIAATISAAKKSWPDKKIAMVFQPHRYTRTRDLFDDFVHVLSEVDHLFLLEVYPAGEDPIIDADSRALCRSIRRLKKVDPILITNNDDLPQILRSVLQNNCVLLSQGAGSVSSFMHKLVNEKK